MHNIWIRLNAVIFFSLTVLLALACLCALSTYFHKGEPIVKVLKLNHLKSLRPYGGHDRAMLTFDLHADLRPAFHWNLKQIFVFVLAEYETKTNPLNQVIIWDRIINSTDDAIIKETNEFVKYALIDPGNELRNKTIKLSLAWDHMPLTGTIYTQSVQKSTFKLPVKYKDV